MARKGMERQGKARKCKAIHGKARQGARHGKGRLDMEIHGNN
jgi:hypothetical protein